jgi:MFS family permease
VRGRFALNATNFFLAQITGLAVPFLADLLREHGWSYDAIGVAQAMSALGVIVFQTPAGVLADRARSPKLLFAVSALLVGLCYLAIPAVIERRRAVDAMLFASGLGQAFFAPLLACLALATAGHAGLGRTVGMNQAWNHAGNVAAAWAALLLVKWSRLSWVFALIAAITILAALSVAAIPSREVDAEAGCGGGAASPHALRELLRDRRTLVLIAASGLFYLASSAVLPLCAYRVKDLGGTDASVAGLVITAQSAMIPVAIVAGFACDRGGRRSVLAVAFGAAPLALLATGAIKSASALIAVQALEGVSLGAFGVAIIPVVADLSAGKGRFNTLTGLVATVLAGVSVVGPLAGGFLAEEHGFRTALTVLAGIAAAGAVIFVAFMPETRPELARRRGPGARQLGASANEDWTKTKARSRG